MEYHRPGSLSEACDLLHALGPEALPLAGGTDVMVDLRRGAKKPRHLVSLADLQELKRIAIDGDELRSGLWSLPPVSKLRTRFAGPGPSCWMRFESSELRR